MKQVSNTIDLADTYQQLEDTQHSLSQLPVLIQDQAQHQQLQDHFMVIRHEGADISHLSSNADYYSLVLSLKGNVIRTVNHSSFHVAPQSLHLVPPHALSSYHQPSSDLQLYIILFKKDFLTDSLIREDMIENLLRPIYNQRPICLIDHERIGLIHHLFHKIALEYEHQQLFKGQMLRLLFLELLLETTRASKNYPEQLNTTLQLSRHEQLVNDFKQLVEENYDRLRTVSEYADLLFVTPKHLSEVVKQQTKQNPLQLIHHRIVKQAKYWLCSSSLTIKEIAIKLNFDTSSHFGRFFKQLAGYNPSKFREIQCAAY